MKRTPGLASKTTTIRTATQYSEEDEEDDDDDDDFIDEQTMGAVDAFFHNYLNLTDEG